MSKKYFDKQNSVEIVTSENTCSSDMDGKHTSLFLVDVVLSPTKNRCLIELWDALPNDIRNKTEE